MKKCFLTGLAVLMPVILTAIVISFLFDLFTDPFLHMVTEFVQHLKSSMQWSFSEGATLFLSRFFAFIFVCILLLVLGAFARWFFLRPIIIAIEKLLGRIPLVKTVYKIMREMITALFATDGKKAFKRPVIFPFPDDPIYCVGFETGEIAKECQEKVSDPLLPIFIPTAPHPISGFLFLMPEKKVKSFDMNNEDALKYLLSCGLVYPGSTNPPDTE